MPELCRNQVGAANTIRIPPQFWFIMTKWHDYNHTRCPFLCIIQCRSSIIVCMSHYHPIVLFSVIYLTPILYIISFLVFPVNMPQRTLTGPESKMLAVHDEDGVCIDSMGVFRLAAIIETTILVTFHYCQQTTACSKIGCIRLEAIDKWRSSRQFTER